MHQKHMGDDAGLEGGVFVSGAKSHRNPLLWIDQKMQSDEIMDSGLLFLRSPKRHARLFNKADTC